MIQRDSVFEEPAYNATCLTRATKPQQIGAHPISGVSDGIGLLTMNGKTSRHSHYPGVSHNVQTKFLLGMRDEDHPAALASLDQPPLLRQLLATSAKRAAHAPIFCRADNVQHRSDCRPISQICSAAADHPTQRQFATWLARSGNRRRAKTPGVKRGSARGFSV